MADGMLSKVGLLAFLALAIVIGLNSGDIRHKAYVCGPFRRCNENGC